MIDNFATIDKFLKFEPGMFYKFELLIRNTDGDNVLYTEGSSKTNKNILIKSWYVDNKEYYKRIKHEMVTLANLTGARLYVTLDRKSVLKFVQEIMHGFTNALCDLVQGKELGIKKLSKVFASKASVVEVSDHGSKTVMFDIDSKNEYLLKGVCWAIEYHFKQQPYVLETKQGWHVFCYKKFNPSTWLETIEESLKGLYTHIHEDEVDRIWNVEAEYTKFQQRALQFANEQNVKEFVDYKDNALGLVYHPTATIE